MSTNFINKLPQASKIWAAEALAGIIVADGVVTKEELKILRESITFLEDLSQVTAIIEKVKAKELPKLEILKCDRKVAANLLMSLAMVAVTDDAITQPEEKYFVYISGKLGFEMQYALKVIRWAQGYIKLSKEKKTLLTIGENSSAIYNSL